MNFLLHQDDESAAKPYLLTSLFFIHLTLVCWGCQRCTAETRQKLLNNPAFAVYSSGSRICSVLNIFSVLPFIYYATLVHFIQRCAVIQAFTFVSVRTLRLICACAEDYSCLNEVESTPKAAAMWVNQLKCQLLGLGIAQHFQRNCVFFINPVQKGKFGLTVQSYYPNGGFRDTLPL